jgi:hypothetical protein
MNAARYPVFAILQIYVIGSLCAAVSASVNAASNPFILNSRFCNDKAQVLLPSNKGNLKSDQKLDSVIGAIVEPQGAGLPPSHQATAIRLGNRHVLTVAHVLGVPQQLSQWEYVEFQPLKRQYKLKPAVVGGHRGHLDYLILELDIGDEATSESFLRADRAKAEFSFEPDLVVYGRHDKLGGGPSFFEAIPARLLNINRYSKTAGTSLRVDYITEGPPGVDVEGGMSGGAILDSDCLWFAIHAGSSQKEVDEINSNWIPYFNSRYFDVKYVRKRGPVPDMKRATYLVDIVEDVNMKKGAAWIRENIPAFSGILDFLNRRPR